MATSGEETITRKQVVHARRSKDNGSLRAGPVGPVRDERGLTPWHYRRGQQIICGTCNCRPCAPACPEQWMPDRPEWKAARANRHLEGAPWQEQQQEQEQSRRIPVDAAMAQAMAVFAGEARAEDMVPVYEEASPGS